MELSERATHLDWHIKSKESELRSLLHFVRTTQRDLSDLGHAFRSEVLEIAGIGDGSAAIRGDREVLKIASRCKNPEHWCGRAVCTSMCGALIFHGPGHQSKSHCTLTESHSVHSYGEWTWEGDKGSSGFEV